jgi:hypothetical protein
LVAIVHSADDALRGRATVLLMHFGSGYEEEIEFLKDALEVRLVTVPECGCRVVAGHPRHGRGALTHIVLSEGIEGK